jgi:hypothetical protein
MNRRPCRDSKYRPCCDSSRPCRACRQVALVRGAFALQLLASLFRAAAILLACRHVLLAAALAELLLGGGILVTDSLAMLGVVLPALLRARAVVAGAVGVAGAIAAVDVVAVRVDLVAVEIVLAVDVDVDVIAAPVAVAPDGAADDHARGE